MKVVQIPNYVDDQNIIFWLETDELAVASTFFIFGYVLRELTVCIVLAWIGVRLFKGWKANQLNGVLIHMSYEFGWTRLNEVFKHPNVREWIQ